MGVILSTSLATAKRAQLFASASASLLQQPCQWHKALTEELMWERRRLMFTCNCVVQLMWVIAPGIAVPLGQTITHTSCAAKSITLADTVHNCYAWMTLEARSLRIHAARHAGPHRRVRMCSFTCCCQVLESLGGRGAQRGVAKCGGHHVVHDLRARELLPSHHKLQAGRPCSLQMRLLVFLSAHYRLLIQAVTLSLV